ncbi:TetR/AcrR family transcriptional regulator [Frateuria aurantia]
MSGSTDGSVPVRRRRTPGRPRDPDLDARVFDTVLRLFGRKGWSGFSIEAVAAECRVGKASIYLRWKDKQHLLCAAIKAYLDEHPVFGLQKIAGGLQREQLVQAVVKRAEGLFGEYGLAMMRLRIEMRADPELWIDELWQMQKTQVVEARRWLQQAIDRGEIVTSSTPSQILEAIEGSIYMHMLITPPALRERVLAALSEWAGDLIDSQLRIVGAADRATAAG